MLLLGVIHVWDRHGHEELHRELEPLGPLHQQRETTLRGRGLHARAPLLQKLLLQHLHPCIHHPFFVSTQLQCDEVPQVRVVLVHVQVEVGLLPSDTLAIQDVVQRDDLPRGLAEARHVHRRGAQHVRDRHNAAAVLLRLGNTVQQRPRELVDGCGREGRGEPVGRRPLHVVRPLAFLLLSEEDRLIHQAAVMPMLRLRVLVVGVDNAAVAAPESTGIHQGADHQRVVPQAHEARVHTVVSVHQAVANVHLDAKNGAFLGIVAAKRLLPLRDRLGVRLLFIRLVLRVAVNNDLGGCANGFRHQTEPGLDRLASQSHGPAHGLGLTHKEPSDLRRVHHRQSVHHRARKQHSSIQPRDFAIPEHPVQQCDGDHVEDNVPEEVEAAQLQRHVHGRSGQQRRAYDHKHIEDLATNHGTNADVGGMEYGDGVQCHLGPIAAKSHQRRTCHVVRDLESVADDIDCANEVLIAHVCHAPEEVEDRGPPQPAEVGDIDRHIVGGKLECRGGDCHLLGTNAVTRVLGGHMHGRRCRASWLIRRQEHQTSHCAQHHRQIDVPVRHGLRHLVPISSPHRS
mmetsp:Transcript_79874/g.258862  ORF Transcript_79874/g.258862 Transcript_79874/m.258862 type:complete len:569 (-) Transcript_79874:39-1745(-)